MATLFGQKNVFQHLKWEAFRLGFKSQELFPLLPLVLIVSTVRY